MGNTVFKEKNVIARKDYYSDYRDQFDFLITKDEKGHLIVNDTEAKVMGMDLSEINLIQSCIDNNWKINKGDLHYNQSGIYDGDLYNVRAPLGIHDICVKYDLFSED